MSRARTPTAIRRFDASKFSVLIVLFVIFIILFVVCNCQNQPAKTGNLATIVPTYTAATQVIRPVLISPATGAQVSAGAAVIRGTGAPSSTLQIIIDDNVVTKTAVSAEGGWTYTATFAAAGEHRVQVQAL